MKNKQLSSSERLAFLLAVLALALVVALLILVPLGPRKRYAQARENLDMLREDLRQKEMLKAAEETRVDSQEVLLERLQARRANFDLFSFLDQQVRETNLIERAKLEKMRGENLPPNHEMVRVDFNNVSLTELVDFLHKVYASQSLIAVRQLDLRPETNGQGLSCEARLVTVKGT